MNSTLKYKLCRLCLSGEGTKVDILKEKYQMEFLVEGVIQDLLKIKVLPDAVFPWLVCSWCITKLNDFRLFRQRCEESQFAFLNCVEEGVTIEGEHETAGREGHSLLSSNVVTDAVSWETNVSQVTVKEEGDDAITIEHVPLTAAHSHSADGVMERDQTIEIAEADPSPSEKRKTSIVDVYGRVKMEEEIVMQQELMPATRDSTSMGGSVTGFHFLEGRPQGGSMEAWPRCKIRRNPEKSDYGRSRISEICDDEIRTLETPMNRAAVRTSVAPSGSTNSDWDGLHECRSCQSRYLSLAELKAHTIEAHSKGETRHTCRGCGKFFKWRSVLLEHERIHTGEKPFLCNVCPRSFKRKAALKRHLLTHTVEKPFTCNACGKSFRKKCTLEMHMMVHAGQRPYPTRMPGVVSNRGNVHVAHEDTHG